MIRFFRGFYRGLAVLWDDLKSPSGTPLIFVIAALWLALAVTGR